MALGIRGERVLCLSESLLLPDAPKHSHHSRTRAGILATSVGIPGLNIALHCLCLGTCSGEYLLWRGDIISRRNITLEIMHCSNKEGTASGAQWAVPCSAGQWKRMLCQRGPSSPQKLWRGVAAQQRGQLSAPPEDLWPSPVEMSARWN